MAVLRVQADADPGHLAQNPGPGALSVSPKGNGSPALMSWGWLSRSLGQREWPSDSAWSLL